MEKRQGEGWSTSDVLARQLALTDQTWSVLRQHGRAEESEVRTARLDFFYVAPGQSAADQLAAFLHERTDYDVTATADSVSGTTQPTALDLARLREWVRWMVVAGADAGRCEFDGWGTPVR